MEKKDYYGVIQRIEEHYINFNTGNYTELYSTYLNTRLGKNQSIDSLSVYLENLVDYLNRLDPSQPISERTKLTTLETALVKSDNTAKELLEVVNVMRIGATNGQPYTYDGLLQSLHLKETQTKHVKFGKNSNGHNKGHGKNHDNGEDEP